MSYEKIAYYYDLLHADLDEDIPFLLEEAAETGEPILELGCGSGRLLRPLARAGYNVTGVDNSRAMLNLAREHLLTEEEAVIRERITIIEGDMLHLDLPLSTFALAIIPYNTFLHFRESQIRPLLRRIRPLLQPNGRFIIDLVNPAVMINMLETATYELEATVPDPRTGRVIQQWFRNQLNVATQTYQIDWIFKELEGEKVMRETAVSIPYHYYFPHQLQMHLNNANFKLQHMYGDYDRTAYTEDNQRLIMVATAA